MTFWIALTLFIIVDAIVIYVVLKRVLMKRAGLGGTGLEGFAGIARFAGVASEEAKNYLAANFGGDPASLPGVLRGLVDRLEQRAAEQGLKFDRPTLKHLAATAVIAHKAAKPADVHAAIESVA